MVAGVGLIACVFGIVLAIIPPAQVAEEVGSPVVYVSVIVAIILVTFAICFVMYQMSKRHNWVDSSNVFAPFTWQIEGLKKPGKVLSNVPSEMMSEGQNPMGMPIKKLWDPNEQIVLPEEYLGHGGHHPSSPSIEAGDDPAAINRPVKTNGVSNTAMGVAVMSQPTLISYKAGLPTAKTKGLKKSIQALETAPVQPEVGVPAAPSDEVEAVRSPRDVTAAAKRATAAEQKAEAKEAKTEQEAHDYAVEAQAYKEQVEAYSDLLDAQRKVKETTAAAKQSHDATKNHHEASTPKKPDKDASDKNDQK